jgi:phospholipase/lecithinase/hemolysin
MERTAVLAAVIATALGSTSAFATAISNIFVIGDSGVDAGNYNADPRPQFNPFRLPSPPYFSGRWSNGPVWTDYVYQSYFGTNMRPSEAGGTNYAYGGAISGGANAKRPDIPSQVRSMTEQTTRLLTDKGGVLDPTALYIVSGGGNDFAANQLLGNPLSTATVTANASAAFNSIIAQLYGAGARNFFINPTGAIRSFIETGIYSGANFRLFDSSAVTSLRTTNPGALGITETVWSCFVIRQTGPTTFLPFTYNPSAPRPTNPQPTDYTVPGFCANPNAHWTLDGTHSTAPVQQALGRAAILQIPEPAAILLLGTGLAGLAMVRRRQRA